MVSAPHLGSQGPSSNHAGGRIKPMTIWHLIAQSLSLLPFHHLDMT